jgi:hypothetical protein
MPRVTIEDLQGLLVAIELAESSMGSGCDVEETLSSVRGATRCYDWVQAEIDRRKSDQAARSARRAARTARP